MQCINLAVGERLAEYEANVLRGEERRDFEEHLRACDFCAEEFGTMAATLEAVEALPQAWVAEELLRTGQDLLRQESWEDAVVTFRALLHVAPNHPAAQAGLRHVAAQLEQRPAQSAVLADLLADLSALLAGLTDRLVLWLSPLWHPPLAGELVTAADTSAQEQVFSLDDGEIRVTCEWRAAYQDQPAMLRITWQAHITLPGDFWVRFTRLDDPTAVLAEVRLGSALEGEEVFTAHALGFDPTQEPWALTLLLKEPQG